MTEVVMLKLISKMLAFFGIDSEAYYINGPSTLPPPLSPGEEYRSATLKAAGAGG